MCELHNRITQVHYAFSVWPGFLMRTIYHTGWWVYISSKRCGSFIQRNLPAPWSGSTQMSQSDTQHDTRIWKRIKSHLQSRGTFMRSAHTWTNEWPSFASERGRPSFCDIISIRSMASHRPPTSSVDNLNSDDQELNQTHWHCRYRHPPINQPSTLTP